MKFNYWKKKNVLTRILKDVKTECSHTLQP